MPSTYTKDYCDPLAVLNNASKENLLWPLQFVLQHLSLSRTTWLAGVKSGKFPQPVRLSPRRVAWRSNDIYTLVSHLETREINTDLTPTNLLNNEKKSGAKVKNGLCNRVTFGSRNGI